MRRVLVFGNSGSGKTTLAASLRRDYGLAHLDLDTLAWQPASPPIRRDAAESERDIRAFTAQHAAWVIEGCYADLLALLLDDATELVFMNPGIDVCERHCRARPWEPHKYASAKAQDRNLAMLLAWVRSYPTRDDACSLTSHRRLFDAFDGLKREVGAGQETAMDDAGLQAQIAGARAYDALFVASMTSAFAPIVAAWGASPVPMDLNDMYNALSTGVVDMVALTPTALMPPWRMSELAKYVTVGVSGLHNPCGAIMNQDSYAALTPAQIYSTLRSTTSPRRPGIVRRVEDGASDVAAVTGVEIHPGAVGARGADRRGRAVAPVHLGALEARHRDRDDEDVVTLRATDTVG
jgi:adenylate kinase family enzyme